MKPNSTRAEDGEEPHRDDKLLAEVFSEEVVSATKCPSSLMSILHLK